MIRGKKIRNRNQSKTAIRKLTTGEEIFNSITHGFGALLSIAALVILVHVAGKRGNMWHVVSFTIYGSSLFLLYLASTLYHSFTKEKVKNLFARFDHAAIFLLIAGTYTPILLTVMRGTLGWVMFGIIWATAIAGVVIRSIYLTRFRNLMVALYLVMGWMFVFVARSVFSSLPVSSTVFLITGGVSYSVGVFFYMNRKLKYSHGIWHLFVLAGSTAHFFAILNILQ